MHYRILSILMMTVCLFVGTQIASAQDTNYEQPVVLYSGTPKTYELAGINVEGAGTYEDYVIIGLSGLVKGQEVTIPGDDITEACKRYWRHGLFSDVSITQDSISGNKTWITIHVALRPRVSDIVYKGVKKSEKDDLNDRIGMLKGGQITPNAVDRAETLIKRYYDDKGFKNAEVFIDQKDDPNNEGQVIVEIVVDKKEKVKVNAITIVGNEVLTDKMLKPTMKKTNEKNKLVNFFRTKKFVEENFEADKQLIIDKYNEMGYRDAAILVDSVSPHDDKTVNVYLEIDEGQRYYLRNVNWVGNTLYSAEQMDYLLRMKKGDVYNQ